MAERSLAAGARKIVKKGLKRLLRDGRSAVEGGNQDDLHALRIAIKHLRYNLEFFVPVLGDETREPLALLVLAQDRLGALADADNFGRTYGALASEHASQSELRPGLQRLRDDAVRERESALEAIRALWRGAEDGPYPDRLAASISAALGSLSKDPEA
jgi:CHAD domain-containing protein